MIETQSQASHITVDVRLCGNLTRNDVNDLLCSRSAFQSFSPIASEDSFEDSSDEQYFPGRNIPLLSTNVTSQGISVLMHQIENINTSNAPNHSQDIYPEKCATTCMTIQEPPSWAEPAKGEARLEPVGDSFGRHPAIDLTFKRSFRVGRSVNSDVQLFHATSSRKHAILFHHSNGSCYVVDCGSAHGTFVNGRQISPPSCGGIVVPFKVRRGAIIRFGGIGAPTYILKSFSFTLEDVRDCSGSTNDSALLVRRNTRMNALGSSATELLNSEECCFQLMNVHRKRSFDSVSTTDSFDEEMDPNHKRMRCSSPPPFIESPIRLVSPDLSSVRSSKIRRVTFSTTPPQSHPHQAIHSCD